MHRAGSRQRLGIGCKPRSACTVSRVSGQRPINRKGAQAFLSLTSLLPLQPIYHGLLMLAAAPPWCIKNRLGEHEQFLPSE